MFQLKAVNRLENHTEFPLYLNKKKTIARYVFSIHTQCKNSFSSTKNSKHTAFQSNTPKSFVFNRKLNTADVNPRTCMHKHAPICLRSEQIHADSKTTYAKLDYTTKFNVQMSASAPLFTIWSKEQGFANLLNLICWERQPLIPSELKFKLVSVTQQNIPRFY